MQITTADEPIHAGWVTVELKTAADVETFNSSAFRDEIGQAFRDEKYESPRYDDEIPYLEVLADGGTISVIYKEDGWYETDRATLPATVSIWSFDSSIISLAVE